MQSGKRRSLASILSVLAGASVICSVGAAVDMDYSRDEIMIPYQWRYHHGAPVGQNPQAPDFLDADWPKWLTPWSFIHAPTPLTPPGYNGLIWYRMRFLVPERNGGTALLCEFGRILGAAEAYVNGRKLALDTRRGMLFADVPLDALKRDTPNVLAMRVSGDAPGAGRVVGPLHLTWQNLARQLQDRVRVVPLPTDVADGSGGVRVEFRRATDGEQWRLGVQVVDYFGRQVAAGTVTRPPDKTAWDHEFPFAVESNDSYRVRFTDEGTGETVTRYVRCDDLQGRRQRLLLSSDTWKILPVTGEQFGELPAATADWEGWTVPPLGDQYTNWRYQSQGRIYNRPFLLACQPFMKHNCHRGWFTRTFSVPRSMAGKTILLRFDASWGTTEVYLNGRKVGEHADSFTPFTCDVTSAARIGEENVLHLAVADLTSYLNPDKVDSVRSSAGVYRRRPLNVFDGMVGGWGTMSHAPGYQFGGPWQDVHLLARPKVCVEDVAITSQVKGRRLEAEISVANRRAERVSVTVSGSVWKDGEQLVTVGEANIGIEANSSAVVKLAASADLAQWWPDAPILHRFNVRVGGEDGQVLDSRDTRFGYRQFDVDGTRFKLNGQTYNIRRMSGCALKLCDTPHGLAHYGKYIKNAGRNLWRVQHGQTPFLSPFWLDVADEIGMPLQVEGAWLYRYQDVDSPVFWKNCRKHWRDLAKKCRNRPAVFCYSIGNELQHSPNRTATLPFGVRDAVREVDPTRPIAFDDDDDYLRPGMDFITVHYPYPLGQHLLWPDSAFWLQTTMPVVFNRAPGVFDWQHDRPLVIGEMSDNAYARAPNGVSTILGDEAYLRRPQSWIRAWLEGARMLHDGARLSGVAGLNMWMTGWRDAFVYRQLEPPICAILREYDHNFYAGERITRTFAVLNDGERPEQLQLRWTLSDRTGVIEAGDVARRLEPGGRADVTVDIELPAVGTRSVAALQWHVFDGASVRDHGTREYGILPRPDAVAADTPVAIYDPSGLTIAAMTRLGILTRPVAAITTDAITALACLWIGENALSGEAGYDAGALRQFVSRGGKLIVLRQDAPFAAPTAAATAPDKTHESNRAWIRFPEHPILAGLEGNDFTYWRGRPQRYPPHTTKGPRLKAEPTWPPNHRVCMQAYPKPSQGNFRILLDSGGPDGLKWTPLVEIPSGRGSAVLCQLLLVDVLGAEPAADRLVRNLIDWSTVKPESIAGQLQLLAGGSPGIGQALDKAGIRCREMSQPIDVADLPEQGVMLIGPAEELSTAEATAIAAWTRRGGTVWLHDLQASTEFENADLPADKLVAWWRLDEDRWRGGSRQAGDATGRGNDLTVKASPSGPQAVSGKLGRAAQFSGDGAYLYAAPERDDLRVGGQDFTIMAWVKSADLLRRCGILGMGVADYASTCYGFYQRATEGAAKFYFVMNGKPDEGDPWNRLAAPAHPGWHHLCGVRQAAGELSFYIDGELVAQGGAGALNPDRDGDFFLIGAGDANSQMTPGNGFNGVIDDVRLYKQVAFTAAQVKTVYMQSRASVDSLAAFKGIVPAGLGLAEAVPDAVELASNRGLGAGLSHYELWWRRGRFMWSDRTGAIGDIARRIVNGAAQTGARVLTDPPALLQWQLGDGRLVVDQLRWDALPGQPQAMRVVNTIATNLGCVSVATPPPSLDLEFSTIDIEPYCNRALGPRDVLPDRPLLLDEKDNDLRELPRGVTAFNGATFLTREALVLRSTKLPFLPTQLPPIQVGRKADYLLFLHGAAGAAKGKIGRYIITYSDGLESELAMVMGFNVADWWASPRDLAAAAVGWTGKNPAHSPVSLHVMTWANTHPDKEITSIVMQSANTAAAPMLLGVSCADAKAGWNVQKRFRSFQPLDLATVTNRSLRTGGDAGWPDADRNDLREFETGRMVLNGIPALVAPEPRPCLILESPRLTALRADGTARGEFGKDATVSVGRNADAIFFLHASTYGAATFAYEINYADGERDTVSIAGGKQIFGWWKAVDFLPPNVSVAWIGTSPFHYPLTVYWYEWTNRHPDKRIKSIRIAPSAAAGQGIPVILGITLATQ